MRVLSVRAGFEEKDIESARVVLAATIHHPSRTVMVIRRVGPQITRFADKAATRSDPFPWREIVWVTDQRIFLSGEELRLFGGHNSACAVVLDLLNEPAAWLDPGAQLFDIEDAFLGAEGR
jgi:hypothetical protein